MIRFERRNGVPQMTLEHYERDFGDRHLLHGIYVVLEPGTFPLNRVAKTDYVGLKERAVAEVARLRAAGEWDRTPVKA